MKQALSSAIEVGTKLPEGWEWDTLGNVSNLQAGNPAPQGDEYFRSGRYPFVRVFDMGRLGTKALLTETRDTINDLAAEKLKLIPRGSILFTKSGASTLLNQRAILGKNSYVVSHIACATPKEEVTSAWLYYWMKTIDFNYLAHATTLPSLPISKARDIPVPVAPLKEQHGIVAEIEKQFSRLDEAVANLKRVKANLKRYKAAVLKAAVEGKLTEEWRKEHPDVEPASELLKRILAARRRKWEEAELAKMHAKGKEPKDDKWKEKYKEPEAPGDLDFPIFPSWTTSTVMQIAEKVQYGSSSKTSEDASGIPVLRMGNIINGELRLEKLKYLPTDHNEFPELFLEKNDLLFNRTNSPELVGKTAVYKGIPDACSFASYLIRVRLNMQVNPIFYSYFLNSYHGRQWIKSVVTQQVGQANVNGTKLQALTVPLPPTVEQDFIVSEVEQLLSNIQGAENEAELSLVRADRLRQSILKKAYSGELFIEDDERINS